ncbi:MAG: hypothetical protein KDB04_00515 [Acidimicrobiales bacterium]|nr:hypothetical protein [Acidimicrobiales bacterium]HRW38089.1 hypothetical protein [Aquihabitans sp.]
MTASPEAPAFCDGCGRPCAECAGCRWAYDPPHFCATCGVRMAVNVSPNGWRARCKQHGELASQHR